MRYIWGCKNRTTEKSVSLVVVMDSILTWRDMEKGIKTIKLYQVLSSLIVYSSLRCSLTSVSNQSTHSVDFPFQT